MKLTTAALAGGAGATAATGGAAAATAGGYGVGSYGAGDYGTTEEQTDGGTTTAPVIESLDVTESSPPSPHAEFTVEWIVAAPDSRLKSVEMTVHDMTGAIETRTISSLWPNEVGSTDFRIKYGAGRTFRVEFTVTDDAGNEVTAERTVQA
jgi:hypothetical protein